MGTSTRRLSRSTGSCCLSAAATCPSTLLRTPACPRPCCRASDGPPGPRCPRGTRPPGSPRHCSGRKEQEGQHAQVTRKGKHWEIRTSTHHSAAVAAAAAAVRTSSPWRKIGSSIEKKKTDKL